MGIMHFADRSPNDCVLLSARLTTRHSLSTYLSHNTFHLSHMCTNARIDCCKSYIYVTKYYSERQEAIEEYSSDKDSIYETNNSIRLTAIFMMRDCHLERNFSFSLKKNVYLTFSEKFSDYQFFSQGKDHTTVSQCHLCTCLLQFLMVDTN